MAHTSAKIENPSRVFNREVRVVDDGPAKDAWWYRIRLMWISDRSHVLPNTIDIGAHVIHDV